MALVLTWAVGAVVLIGGAWFAVNAFKWPRTTIFFSSFVVGTFLVVLGQYIVAWRIAWAMALLLSVIGGVLLGLVMLRCVKTGTPIVGTAAGIVLSLVLHSWLELPEVVLLLLLVGITTVCTWITWKFPQRGVVVATSFMGTHVEIYGFQLIQLLIVGFFPWDARSLFQMASILLWIVGCYLQLRFLARTQVHVRTTATAPISPDTQKTQEPSKK